MGEMNAAQQFMQDIDNDDSQVSSSEVIGDSNPDVLKLRMMLTCEKSSHLHFPFCSKEYDQLRAFIASQRVGLTALVDKQTDSKTREVHHITDHIALEAELQHTQWLLDEYLRVRINKIERHYLWLELTPSARAALADFELAYLRTFTAARKRLHSEQVLRYMPATHQGYGGREGFDTTIADGPDDQYVLGEAVNPISNPTWLDGQAVTTVNAGDRMIIKLSKIREYVLQGSMTLR